MTIQVKQFNRDNSIWKYAVYINDISWDTITEDMLDIIREIACDKNKALLYATHDFQVNHNEDIFADGNSKIKTREHRNLIRIILTAPTITFILPEKPCD